MEEILNANEFAKEEIDTSPFEDEEALDSEELVSEAPVDVLETIEDVPTEFLEQKKGDEQKEEEPEDPVVPADLGEEEKTKQKLTVQPKKVKKVNARKLENVKEDVGIKSDELLQEETRFLTEEEKIAKLHGELLTHKRDEQILWGEIIGVAPSENLATFMIQILWNGIEISIPDSQFFEPSFNFGANYEGMDNNEKLTRRMTVAKYYMGGHIPFIIKAVREKRTEENSEMIQELIVFGSRTEAMALLRDIWFIHSKRKRTKGGTRSVNIGDLAFAHVLSVRDDRVVVEAFGVETRISAHELTNAIVENCAEVVRPGDKIKVRVRDLYINEKENKEEAPDIYLTVTGRIRTAPKQIRSMKVGSTYIGTVDRYNRSKDLYSVILRNGVRASVLRTQVLGMIPLKPGDVVAVKVQVIKDEYVQGIALKQY